MKQLEIIQRNNFNKPIILETLGDTGQVGKYIKVVSSQSVK